MMPAQRWRRRRRNKGNDAGATTANAPAQQWQQCHHNNGKKPSTVMAMAPLHQRQRGQRNNVPTPSVAKYNASLSSLHPPPLCWSRRRLTHNPPKSCHCLSLCCLLCRFPQPLFLWLIVVCWVGGRGRVPVELQLPHPPLSLIFCPLLLPRVPLPGKVYIILRHHCCLCPLWAAALLVAFLLHQTQSTMHHHHYCTPPSSLPEPTLPCLSSSNSCHTLPFHYLCRCLLHPLPTMVGCCVLGRLGQTSSMLSLPLGSSSSSSLSPHPPHQECRVETCKGEKGCGGDCLGIDTAPLPCCGRAGKGSKRMFSWS
jgi:hypothetical protein